METSGLRQPIRLIAHNFCASSVLLEVVQEAHHTHLALEQRAEVALEQELEDPLEHPVCGKEHPAALAGHYRKWLEAGGFSYEVRHHFGVVRLDVAIHSLV